MTNAERMKKYREKLKKNKVKHEETKAKSRIRNNSIRTKLSGPSLAEFRNKNKLRQQKYRDKKKQALNNTPTTNCFKSRQSFGKVLKKVNSSLPQCENKKTAIIEHLAQSVGLIPKRTHERSSLQISDKIKDHIYNFYIRDDVSYQLPGKRDTIVVKQNDGSKITYQKRILFNSLRENYELFIEENQGMTVSRSFFAELRPPFVILKAALAHRNCLCIYHENVCLLLKSLHKSIRGNYCSLLEMFGNSLVCDTNNVDCMFSRCLNCEDFKKNIHNNISDHSIQITWSQWTNESGRSVKKEFSGKITEAVLLLESKVEHFLIHVYIKRQQSNYFEHLKENVTEEKVLLQVDFAENFNMKEQDEIQTAHWASAPLSIFTAFVWSKKTKFFIRFTIIKCEP